MAPPKPPRVSNGLIGRVGRYPTEEADCRALWELAEADVLLRAEYEAAIKQEATSDTLVLRANPARNGSGPGRAPLLRHGAAKVRPSCAKTTCHRNNT